MSKDKWIQDAVKKKGSLRESLHIRKGQNIPKKTLNKAANSANPLMKKRAVLAKTLGKLKK